jgi:integrase/recombinase XerD
MVAVVNGDHIDIHNYQQRLERAVRFLKAHPKVTDENKVEILKFLEHIKAENLSLARQVSYVQWMTTIAVTLRRKDFTQTKKQDVEVLLAKFNAREWSDATKENYHEAVKKFWRWLRKLPKGEDPEETEWVKVGGAKGRKLVPKELLTGEEANSLIAAAEHPRDKAYAAVTDETGARPEEILSAKIRQVQFDEYGAVLMVNGKTGWRRIRLIRSAPLLARWLDNHPRRDDPNSPLWVNVGTTRHGGAFDYNAARKILRELGRRAGIKKRIYPYLFRHSTATRLANLLTEAQMCQYFGWRQGSRMPSFYVHLSGRDVDNKMLELYGLKQKDEGLAKEIQVCQRCQSNNSPVSKFCNRCGSALNLRSALETDQRINTAGQVMETLLKDPEVKSLLAEKIRTLGLAEKLP